MDIVIGPMDVAHLTSGICPMCGSSTKAALPITIPEPDEVSMATTVVLTNVIKRADGSCEVAFADGSAFVFQNMEHLRSEVMKYDLDQDLCKSLCIAYVLARSANLTNISTVQNKNFTFDMTAQNCIRVQ